MLKYRVARSTVSQAKQITYITLASFIVLSSCHTSSKSTVKSLEDGAPVLRPSLDAYAPYMGVPPLAGPGQPDSGVRVTFLGTTSLLFTDGQTSWITDGFFTRPNLLAVGVATISPDRDLVQSVLRKAHVQNLSAVIAIHSHHDHAMDAPLVAQLTGAKLMGSESTAYIGRGYGLPESMIQVIHAGDSLSFGDFKVTVIGAEHSPNPHFPGTIDSPVIPPAKASDYKVGECFSLLVEHHGQKLLVHGSAGYRPGALKGYSADTIFLGTGTLGKQDLNFQMSYWAETVQMVNAKRIVAVHWDDFYSPLDQPLLAPPWILDDLPNGMDFLIKQAAAEQREFWIPLAYNQLDPFSPAVPASAGQASPPQTP